ncbi:MAG TPA: hypothetical protein VD707_01880 [Gemmatimonadales bacterium]|jgi:hypothetical protein|nr:hypothetical protein [Gemmatimonadales bacterium]
MPRSGLAALAAIAVLACDGGLQPVARCPSGICGTVTIRGTEPESTHAVFIIAYRTFPQTCDDIPDFVPFPPPSIALGDTVASYTLPLPNGQYEWIVAAWKKLGPFTLTPADTAVLREAGFYRDPPGSSTPGTVTVSGTGVDSVDFVVDFDSLHPITDYVTCAGR